MANKVTLTQFIIEQQREWGLSGKRLPHYSTTL
jgi:hypothetical protein